MRSLRSVHLAGIVGGVLVLALPVYGQVNASVEGFIGYYRPFGHYEAASAYLVGMPSQPSDMQGMVWGATGRVGIGPRFGVAAQLATARSRSAKVLTPAGGIGPTSASVVLGSLLGQYDISTNPRAYHLRVNAGPAFVRRGGDAYRAVGSATSFAPAFGTTILVPLLAHLQLSADATGMFYSANIPMPADLRGNPGPLQHGRQRDLLIHLGVAWTSW